MRDLTKPVEVTLGGETLSLRLDMTAMADFEAVAGMTVTEFLRPAVPVLRGLQERATGAGDVDANETGLQMIEELLSVETLSATNLRALAWALAGGEDLTETPREFGRRVNLGSGRDLVTALLQALNDGSPDADEAAPDPFEEDPTPRPE